MLIAWIARPTTSTKVELTRQIGPVFVGAVVGTVDPETIEGPIDGLSQKFLDLSHARYLLRDRQPGIGADQATYASWTRRCCLVWRG
jgi:hypothetical protein